jgi:hypothetical protein
MVELGRALSRFAPSFPPHWDFVGSKVNFVSQTYNTASTCDAAILCPTTLI